MPRHQPVPYISLCLEFFYPVLVGIFPTIAKSEITVPFIGNYDSGCGKTGRNGAAVLHGDLDDVVL